MRDEIRPARGARTRLSGWGRTAWSVSDLVVPRDGADLSRIVSAPGPRGVIARGLGRSYGAAAQNAGGTVVVLAGDADSRGPDMLLDGETGMLDAAAGVSIDAVLRHSVPRGWFVPVTPGTRHVTLGGAVAADVHGKNHHVDGSFCDHVTSLDIVLADGSTETLDRVGDARRFWATAGGMGLTGVVTRVRLRMTPVETSRMRVETLRTANLDAAFAELSAGGDDDAHRYTVCWIDMLASGASMGRGVLTRGDHATTAEVGGDDPLGYSPRQLLSAPPWVPGGLLNKATIRAFNEVWFRRAPRTPHVGIETIPAFFHPLDGVRGWNRLYGSRGFIQYQFIVPIERTDVVRAIVSRFSAAGAASFLAVLKRMGTANAGPISFPMPGWTLSLDVPARAAGLSGLLGECDRLVLDAGGRHYLAKDAHVAPSAVRAGYPRLAEWQEIVHEMDPTGVFRSDLSRRLALT